MGQKLYTLGEIIDILDEDHYARNTSVGALLYYENEDSPLSIVDLVQGIVGRVRIFKNLPRAKTYYISVKDDMFIRIVKTANHIEN